MNRAFAVGTGYLCL